jgi:hypothetical protein
VNALAKAEVGEYLNEHFVSSYQKVGTFQLVGGQKQGGNVASYFCSPDGQVVHLIAGPVNARTFLREARWAVETWKLAQLESPESDAGRKATLRKAHVARFRQKHRQPPTIESLLDVKDKESRVHLLLALAPLVKLEKAYDLVFEKVLRENVSTNPVIETN